MPKKRGSRKRDWLTIGDDGKLDGCGESGSGGKRDRHSASAVWLVAQAGLCICNCVTPSLTSSLCLWPCAGFWQLRPPYRRTVPSAAGWCGRTPCAPPHSHVCLPRAAACEKFAGELLVCDRCPHAFHPECCGYGEHANGSSCSRSRSSATLWARPRASARPACCRAPLKQCKIQAAMRCCRLPLVPACAAFCLVPGGLPQASSARGATPLSTHLGCTLPLPAASIKDVPGHPEAGWLCWFCAGPARYVHPRTKASLVPQPLLRCVRSAGLAGCGSPLPAGCGSPLPPPVPTPAPNHAACI